MVESPPRFDASAVTDELVAGLVRSQMPDLAHLEIGRHYRMTNHVAVRIGDDWGAMLPLAADLAPYYARATDVIAPHLKKWSFPISAPVRSGSPTADFPYPWVMENWIEASTSAIVPLHSSAAKTLGAVLRAVHTPATDDAPDNPLTQMALDGLGPQWTALLDTLSTSTSPSGLRLKADVMDALWRNGVAADVSPKRVWTHGNMEPRAVLSDQGTFAGLLWWHHFGVGNPCVDLGAAAMLVPTDSREMFFSAYGVTTTHQIDAIQACELWTAARYLADGDPFTISLAWRRLEELDLAYQP